ncbi:MAG: bifunctional 1-(5-phosphoribosyl)-5-((5-phosphoribosylamino)methylideneamino)imidazole-4-carboxamide isomerase/phosphoribosylanthranilate isomerase PriA [Actinobacteria bacterium]|nr:bifunctional 1-(5-phosphoribosyl)-5-((5-phosphoribosylamino)methylideneamino)imidazole-4-carboxamide isomerase/phosphoribosylanthranilate isomerase PriA [Actinomycetota bacterium]
MLTGTRFELLPAVDIADGTAVRLVQGAAGTETSYGDPVAAARQWVEQGAYWLHVVDLDRAFGRGTNADEVAAIVREVKDRCHVEVAGGIRDDESLAAALATGAQRVVIGTAAMESPAWVAGVIAEHGERIAVSLDVRGTTLAARGWTQEGGDVFEAIDRLDAAGCRHYIVTDVERDGTLHGPHFHLLHRIAKHTATPVIASGGIATLEDVHKLVEMIPQGIVGAVIGRALYDGAFTFPELVAAIEPRIDLWTWGPPQP